MSIRHGFPEKKHYLVATQNHTAMNLNLESLRYPVGKFSPPDHISPEQLDHWIADIDHFPSALRSAVEGIGERELDIPYRDGGWCIRQIVHHIADSHVQAFIRTRLALTEERPVIKPYIQDAWGQLEDARSAPVEWSLDIIHGTHKRWASVLRRVEDWKRCFIHPEQQRTFTLDQMLALYYWHSRHHLAQVEGIRAALG